MRRPGASVGLGVLLVVVVIAAAGLAGTPHFSGARFLPQVKSGTHGTPPAVKNPVTAPPATPHQSSGSSNSALWAGVIGLVLVGLLVAWLVRRGWLNRRRPPVGSLTGSASMQAVEVSAPVPPAEPEVLLTGIEHALRALEGERDPGDAVVRAWLGLEETAGESGIQRGPSETPTEFTSQIMRAAFADDRAIGTLLRLYLRTRFGDHPVSADDVSAVRVALQHLVDNWRLSDRRTVTRAS
jgi:hypothetical protein